MKKIIKFNFKEIFHLKNQCYLISPNSESDLVTCYGYPDECDVCEIPRYYPNDTKRELIKLKLGYD